MCDTFQSPYEFLIYHILLTPNGMLIPQESCIVWLMILVYRVPVCGVYLDDINLADVYNIGADRNVPRTMLVAIYKETIVG